MKNPDRNLRLAAIVLLTLSLAACSSETPADQVDAPVGPGDRSTIASPSSPADAVHAVIKKTATTGLCSPDEPVIFSCQLKNRKTISVCAAANGAGDRRAQYRFGVPGQSPELVWPEAGAGDRISFASVPYSGGGEAQLSFSRGDVTYVVYSRIVRTNFTPGEPNDPAITDGIMVLKGKKMASDLVCSDNDVVPVDYELAEQYADPSDEAFVMPGE